MLPADTPHEAMRPDSRHAQINVRTRARAPVVLLAGFALFALAMGYLVATSLVARTALEFDPTPPSIADSASTSAPRASRATDTLTIDARDGRTWRFASLRSARVLAPGDTAGWDIAVRRHRIIANGTLADAGAMPFDDVSTLPTVEFVANTLGSDSSNTATNRWYRYGMLSHLLEPNGHTFVLRATDGRYVKFEVLSYYCRGLEAGCLTIRAASLATTAARSGSSTAPRIP